MLTPIGPEHTAELVQLHVDPNVAYWNAGAWSEDVTRRFAADMHQRWVHDHVGKWIAHRRSDGALVGRGGLSLSVVDEQLRLELGWALRDGMRGQGFATEIGAAGLAYGFDVLGSREVVAYTEAHNHASRAVMERLEMSFVKIIRAPGLVEGSDDVRIDAPFALYRITRAPDYVAPSSIPSRWVGPAGCGRREQPRYRGVNTQNSLPSGSAMTTQLTSP